MASEHAEQLPIRYFDITSLGTPFPYKKFLLIYADGTSVITHSVSCPEVYDPDVTTSSHLAS